MDRDPVRPPSGRRAAPGYRYPDRLACERACGDDAAGLAHVPPDGLGARHLPRRLTCLPPATADPVAVPIELHLYPLLLPRKLSCSLGMWDYTGEPPAYDLTPDNVEAAIANMRSHFLDTPWLQGGCGPWPQGFDEQGNMVGELDFAPFDAWVARWPEATNYGVFLSVGDSLAGVPMTAEHFPQCVASWMSGWVDHLREMDIEPRQLMLLLVDEPSQEEQEQRIITWARAIKAAEPEVIIWEDPVHQEPQEAALPEVFADVLCPNLGIFASGSEASRQFYADWQKQGKTLWFYQCSGPAKTYDPYYYHRLQHWFCFKYGAVGSGFWAYGDAAGAGTSWNELRAGRTSYTPVYIEPDSITDGKHFEAIREGLEDYEYLRMLRDRAAQLQEQGDEDGARRARDLLAAVVDEVCGEGYQPPQIPWTAAKDRTGADRARLRVLQELTGE